MSLHKAFAASPLTSYKQTLSRCNIWSVHFLLKLCFDISTILIYEQVISLTEKQLKSTGQLL